MPSSSYGRGMLRKDGGPNNIFLTYQFCDHAIAIQFLKDVGLLRGVKEPQCLYSGALYLSPRRRMYALFKPHAQLFSCVLPPEVTVRPQLQRC